LTHIKTKENLVVGVSLKFFGKRWSIWQGHLYALGLNPDARRAAFTIRDQSANDRFHFSPLSARGTMRPNKAEISMSL
jgi:hypothetical protein